MRISYPCKPWNCHSKNIDCRTKIKLLFYLLWIFFHHLEFAVRWVLIDPSGGTASVLFSFGDEKAVGWCRNGRLWDLVYGSSKGSKLVIRRSRGSKFPGCNFHYQIYDLASRGLYSTEATPVTSPAKGYCKSHPSHPPCHHTLTSHTPLYWPFISPLFAVFSSRTNPLSSTSSCSLFWCCSSVLWSP